MQKYIFRVEETNNYIRIYEYDEHIKELLKRYSLNTLARWSKVPGETYGSYKYTISHVFATFSHDKKEFRLMKDFYEGLVDFLRMSGVSIENIQATIKPTDVPIKTSFNWGEIKLSPRDEEQKIYLEHILNPEKPVAVVNLRPGAGKTALAIMGFVNLGHRVVITVLPRYVSIWLKALDEFLDLKPEDVLDMSEHNTDKVYEKLKNKEINPKIIFLQLTKIDTYLKRMKNEPDSIVHIDELFKVMGAGVRIIDEAHESIYSVYCSMLYGNPEKTIVLSATLRGDDEFVNKIYKGTFPDRTYLKPPVYDKYINVISYFHRMDINKYRINTKGFGGYSHVMYEKGIMKKGYIFEKYYQMCKSAFERYYIEPLKDRKDGQKAIWFFSTVAMVEKFKERLQKDYPQLDIISFTGETSKKKGMEMEYNNHEIVITTPGSCGTGKDIHKLFAVFSGVSVSSSQKLDQMSGRTRPIHKWWPDLDPIYLTFVCKDVRKQVEYDNRKKQIIGKKAKRIMNIESGHFC